METAKDKRNLVFYCNKELLIKDLSLLPDYLPATGKWGGLNVLNTNVHWLDQKNRDVYCVPDAIGEIGPNHLFIIVSKGFGDFVAGLLDIPSERIAESGGVIDSGGKEIETLQESDMNGVLREVFKINPQKVFLILLNSIWNNKHELAYRNLLKTPGYSSVLSSEQILGL